MKFANLDKVLRLGHDRIRIEGQIERINLCDSLGVTIDGVEQDESIVGPIKPYVIELLRAKIRDIDAKLTELGVER